MSNKDQHVRVIKVLWKNHLPIKGIAEVLNLKYSFVVNLCRSLKAIDEQEPLEELVAQILSPNYDEDEYSAQDIIDSHLASEDS